MHINIVYVCMYVSKLDNGKPFNPSKGHGLT